MYKFKSIVNTMCLIHLKEKEDTVTNIYTFISAALAFSLILMYWNSVKICQMCHIDHIDFTEHFEWCQTFSHECNSHSFDSPCYNCETAYVLDVAITRPLWKLYDVSPLMLCGVCVISWSIVC